MPRTNAQGQPVPNYPGLGDEMSNILEECIQGKFNPLTSRINYRRVVVHNRVKIAASNALKQFQFFTADPATPSIGNFAKAGLGNDSFMLLYGMRFKAETSYALDGTENAGDQIVAGVTEMPLMEKVRALYENGLVNAFVGEKQIVDNVYGLENFPAGVGPEGFAALATTASTVSHGAVVLNNGNPHNQFEFPTPQVLLPQKKLKVVVDYDTAIDPAVEIVLRCSFVGLFVSPFNN